MELLTLQEALDAFYKKNSINPALITGRYEPDKCLDQRLFQLGEKAEEWLETYCSGERSALIQLLACYQYFTDAQMLQIWQTIFDRLDEELIRYEIPWSNILFVTTESQKGVKSGAANIQADFLKVSMDVIEKDQIITTLDKQPLTRLDHIHAVVFLDDIVATGFTMKSTIKTFIEYFKLSELNPTNIRFFWASAVYTKRGERFLSKLKCEFPWLRLEQIAGVRLESLFHLKPEMRKIESILQQVEERVDSYRIEASAVDGGDGRKSYIMGFEACKLLVSTYYDTPNNTMCTFWKVTNQNKPPFRRLNQPCTLYRCQLKKRRTGDIAYTSAKLKDISNET